MNTAKIWRHLFWKDALLIGPLVITIGVATAVSPFLIAALLLANDQSLGAAQACAVIVWLIAPNLVAIGSAAMLVGTEEESGTLGWLRTLPVHWQTVADIKLAVGLVSVVSIWILASAIRVVEQWVWPDLFDLSMGSGAFFSSPVEIAYLIAYSFLLLLSGYVTAYWVRSPITSLLLLLPMAGGVGFLLSWITRLVFGRYWGPTSGDGAAGSQWLAWISAVVGVMAVTVLVQRWLARRRLVSATGPNDLLTASIKPDVSAPAYRPPVAVAGLDRPGPAMAMLWQQVRQISPHVPILFLLGVILFPLSVALSSIRSPSSFEAVLVIVGGIVAPMVASWLGALTFFGDSVRRQCAFFADRGVGPGRVWWTRVVPTLVPALVVAVVAAVAVELGSPSGASRVGLLLGSTLMVLYGVSQLVSQWSRRPTLAFFASPALALIMLAMLVPLAQSYIDYAWTILGMVPVLLFASRRLTGKWLDGDLGRGFTGRVCAYAALAVAMPILIMLGMRWATMPSSMTAWQAEMQSLADQTYGPRRDMSSPVTIYPNENAVAARLTVSDLSSDIDSRLKNELEAEGTIGEFVSLVELSAIVMGWNRPAEAFDNAMTMPETFAGASDSLPGSPDGEVSVAGQDSDRIATAIDVLLKWSTLIRKSVIAGQSDLEDLIGYGEPAEYVAVYRLVELLEKQPGDARWVALAKKVPSERLRNESRYRAVISEWQRYRRKGWSESRYTMFAGDWLLFGNQEFAIERVRTDRFVDRATKMLIEQMENGRLFSRPTEVVQWQAIWDQARYGPRLSVHGNDALGNTPFVRWVKGLAFLPDLETKLRSLVASAAD